MSNLTWQISALKYDQRPHYTWPATLVADHGEHLFLRTIVGGLLVHYSRGFQEPQSNPSDLTFWRDRWYNVFTNYDALGYLRNFYCNVAMPPIVDPDTHTIKYVDLDLDVRVYPDGSYKILDEDEFAAHTVEFSYPQSVQQRAKEAVNDIIVMARAGQGPFSILNNK